MTHPIMLPLHKRVLAHLLVLGSDMGLTETWAEGQTLDIELSETEDRVPLVTTAQTIEGAHPELLTVLQGDPVVRFETSAPVVTFKISALVWDLIADGFFDDAFYKEGEVHGTF